MANTRVRTGAVVLGVVVAGLCAAWLGASMTPPERPAASAASVTPTAAGPGVVEDPAPEAPASADAVQTGDTVGALAMLAGVPSDASWQGTGGRYDRDAFGERWADVDGNGCDTRNDVLRRDLTQVVLRDGSGCKVLSGMLRDPYTGATVDFVSGEDTSPLVPIDHVVALAWAWRHGADTWTPEQRLAFANDPRNLVATTHDVNQDKADAGPAEWLPPDEAAHCEYAEQYVAVLAAWRLTVDAADRATLTKALQVC